MGKAEYSDKMTKLNAVSWNRVRYTIYAPIYNWAVKFANNSRKNSIASLNLDGTESILIVGAGTGLDLDYIPSSCKITATDITPAMVHKIQQRAELLNKDVKSEVMDGQKLFYDDKTFDIVILHLILAVIPDPIACINEVERVLKPEGKIAVYDKFVKTGLSISLLRKIINSITSILATDITRSLESIIENTSLKVVSDVSADFGGNFRRIILKKPTY